MKFLKQVPLVKVGLQDPLDLQVHQDNPVSVENLDLLVLLVRLGLLVSQDLMDHQVSRFYLWE